jgi:UDP-N-acetylmuramoyl-tripeptide--D-alanyl-D-alanine ligase
MELALAEVASILESVSEAPERVARSYSIDSRTLSAGALFFAIRGPNFDGHSFVGRALEAGASGAVVDREWAASAPAAMTPFLIGVADTVLALQSLARTVRRQWGRPVVAVTGSTGKTTAKELIAAVLAGRYAVHKSAENLNNHLGVPLTLLALSHAHEVAVLELGMSHAGEIAHLAAIAGPALGVVTNVAPAHLEFFESLDGIAAAKRELIEHLVSPATAILNYDDERVRNFREGFTGRVATFGFGLGADYRAGAYQLEHAGDSLRSTFRVRGPNCEAEFRLPLPGRYNVANALAALAVGNLLGVSPGAMADALAAVKPLLHRAEIVRLPTGVTLIDDSYNSNPRALDQMLELLRDWPGAGRRIVVAGEMLELGPTAPEWHRAAGRHCVRNRIDWILAVQGDARFLVEGALSEGFPPSQARFFVDPAEAGFFCRSIVRPGDVVLVKGSRGVHLEKGLEQLKAAP